MKWDWSVGDGGDEVRAFSPSIFWFTPTLIKKKTKFSSYTVKGNLDGIGCKVI
jgi:hypothetical protein